MSKSLGNFYTLRDLTAQGWTGREVRYALISVRYRLPLNFTMEGLAAARSALARIDEWCVRLEQLAGPEPEPHALSSKDGFAEALDEDLNISAALAELFETITESNRLMNAQALTPGNARALLQWWARVNQVLAFEREAEQVSDEVANLLEQRQQARANKDWAASDRLRDAIVALGWQLKDTKDGQKVTRIAG